MSWAVGRWVMCVSYFFKNILTIFLWLWTPFCIASFAFKDFALASALGGAGGFLLRFRRHLHEKRGTQIFFKLNFILLCVSREYGLLATVKEVTTREQMDCFNLDLDPLCSLSQTNCRPWLLPCAPHLPS